jgi:predicted adenylyl cyclase CyaB
LPENIEIKARLRDAARAHRLARALSETPARLIAQRDVFFHTQRGRLKLRLQGGGCAYLVYYERPDQAGPRSSVYYVSESHDASSLERALSAALGVRGEVRKLRALYVVGSTRIHIDEVEDLGHFLELEAVLDAGQTAADGHAAVASLMDQLQVSEADLIGVAYIDLLECARRERSDCGPTAG